MRLSDFQKRVGINKINDLQITFFFLKMTIKHDYENIAV